MTKRYVLVSASVTKSTDLVKKINELLSKGYELYGSPCISVTENKETVHQALIVEK